MSAGNDITTEAIRLAMSMTQLRADLASQNIAKASTPGAQATRLDFGTSQGLLDQLAATPAGAEGDLLAALSDATGRPAAAEYHEAPGTAINLDEEVADMASASLRYQSLTESLNRQFGLMRLAISGKN